MYCKLKLTVVSTLCVVVFVNIKFSSSDDVSRTITLCVKRLVTGKVPTEMCLDVPMKVYRSTG